MSTLATKTGQESGASSDAESLDSGPERIVASLSPSRLGARALVEGYPTRGLEGAKYLEIGSDRGAGLLAHAAAFVEVDFTMALTTEQSPPSGLAQEVNVPNLDQVGLELTNFDATGLGSYDFIAATDVFSTASTSERMALLVLTKKHLSKTGIACIGLDVEPGWSFVENLRSVLCGDLDQRFSPEEKVKLIRLRITELANSISAGGNLERQHQIPDLKRLVRASDAEIYRDLLNPNHKAIAVSEFLAMAAAAKLKPIGDVDPVKSNLDILPPSMRPKDSNALSPAAIYEQIDRFANTRRRQVLLVHGERQETAFDLRKGLNDFCVTSRLSRADKRLKDKDLLTVGAVTFAGPLRYRTENLIEIVTLALLEKHRYFPVRPEHLIGHVFKAVKTTTKLSVEKPDVAKAVFLLIQKLIPTGAFVASLCETRAAPKSSDRPTLAPLALLQARRGADYVASMVPHQIAVDETSRFILSRFDGTQTVQQVSAELATAASKGELTLVAKEGTPEARAKATILRVVGHAARSGLLVA